jgi:predicted metal-binding protein
MEELDKYKNLAISQGMVDAVLISPDDICIDIRANLKCAWGCDRSTSTGLNCDSRNTTFAERVEMIKRYSCILLVHSHDAVLLSRTLLELERLAFLDGYYFAFALRACHLCEECAVSSGKACSFPKKVRPCDQLFGIDVYKTVRQLGLPCEVLQDKEDTQNRYGFLLIE